ncbi:MAG TPA: tripartite tricarboxylate transporter substrate binding protein [Alphaproteobacteria bacterium]
MTMCVLWGAIRALRCCREVLVAASIWAALAGAGASAQTYPTRPVTVIVPLAAGSTTDILARVMAAELSKSLGQTVVVDDRPGAGGTIGMRQVAQAAPDGYTLLLGTNSTLAINVGLFSHLPYDSIKDFAPILQIASSSNVLIVGPASPVNSLKDLMALARAKPGQLTFSSGGNGTTHHLSGALFNAMAGVEAVHVPYKGAPQGISAVMSGEVSFGFFNTPNIVPVSRDRLLKTLAVTSLERSPLLSELPTMAEAGLPGYETTVSFGLLAPAKTPPAIVTRLYDESIKILAHNEVREKLTEQGYDVGPSPSPADYARQIQADIDKWVPIVKATGASLD